LARAWAQTSADGEATAPLELLLLLLLVVVVVAGVLP
jgi:hypothetical protein